MQAINHCMHGPARPRPLSYLLVSHPHLPTRTHTNRHHRPPTHLARSHSAGPDGGINCYLGVPGATQDARARVPEGGCPPPGSPWPLEFFIKVAAGFVLSQSLACACALYTSAQGVHCSVGAFVGGIYTC